MKKIFFGVILFLSSNCFSYVPVSECIHLYQNTKAEYLALSPAISRVMLESGQLQGIRFFGNFSSVRHPEFDPHLDFTETDDLLKGNAPQDAISALFQYLFPSRNGYQLAFNQRQNDPVGHLSKKDNLSKISELLKAIFMYYDEKNEEKLEIQIKKLIEKTRTKNDRKGKTKITFDSIALSFVNILKRAVVEESKGLFKNRYPDYIVVHSLLAFFMMSADSVESIYQHFDWLFKQELEKQEYSADSDINAIVNDKQIKSVPDAVLYRLFINQLATHKYPKPLSYITARYNDDKNIYFYPNCGETSLLNFFYYMWGNAGIIDPSKIDDTEQKLPKSNQNISLLERWEALKTYFKDFPTIDSSLSTNAQIRWSQLISDMNSEDCDPSLRIDYRKKVCNIKGIGLINMLNVLEKLIPHPFLSNPFNHKNANDNFVIAAEKISLLCSLFSNDEYFYDWNLENTTSKQIKDVMCSIEFSVNHTPVFVWKFSNDSFSIKSIFEEKREWSQWIKWDEAMPCLRAWAYRQFPDKRNQIEDPSDLFALNLHDPNASAFAIEKILEKYWLHLLDFLPQIVNKALLTHDYYTSFLLYCVLHKTKINCPELNWKNYIPNFKVPPEDILIGFAAENGLLNVLKHYNLQKILQIEAHFIASASGYTYVTDWLVDQRPDILQHISDGDTLFDLALKKPDAYHIQHLLRSFKNKHDFFCYKGGLLNIFMESSCDVVCYLDQLWDEGLRFNQMNFWLNAHPLNQNWALSKITPENNDLINNVDCWLDVSDSMIPCLEEAVRTRRLDVDVQEELLRWYLKDGKIELAESLMRCGQVNLFGYDHKGNSFLHDAAWGGVCVDRLLGLGLKIDQENNEGLTPFHTAMKSSYFGCNQKLCETISIFLKHKGDLNKRSSCMKSPFEYALDSCFCPSEALIFMLQHGAKVKPSQLTTWLKNQKSVDALESVWAYLEDMNPNALTQIKNSHSQSLLFEAVSELRIEAVDFFLKKDFSPHQTDQDGKTCLHHLFLQKRPNDYTFLKEEGVLPDDFIDSPSTLQLKIARLLIEQGGDIHARDDYGLTPVHLAMPYILIHPNLDLWNLFLENGADKHVLDSEGNSLAHALFEPSMDIGSEKLKDVFYIDRLRNLGLDYNKLNSKGETPFTLYITNMLTYQEKWPMQFNSAKASGLFALGSDPFLGKFSDETVITQGIFMVYKASSFAKEQFESFFQTMAIKDKTRFLEKMLCFIPLLGITMVNQNCFLISITNPSYLSADEVAQTILYIEKLSRKTLETDCFNRLFAPLFGQTHEMFESRFGPNYCCFFKKVESLVGIHLKFTFGNRN